jgi:hypothetical protein
MHGAHGRSASYALVPPSVATTGRNVGARMNRAVWYLEATFPPRVRHGDGAITLQFGQS